MYISLDQARLSSCVVAYHHKLEAQIARDGSFGLGSRRSAAALLLLSSGSSTAAPVRSSDAAAADGRSDAGARVGRAVASHSTCCLVCVCVCVFMSIMRVPGAITQTR